jgi:hypothetical protein
LRFFGARYRLQFLRHELHAWNWEDDRLRRNRDLFDVDVTSVEPKEIQEARAGTPLPALLSRVRADREFRVRSGRLSD